MTQKSINKTINSSYASTIIPLCRLLKEHATNMMLLSNNLILLQPSMNGIRNYMIVNPDVDYSNFIYTYFSIPEITKVNSKFRKTKSEIDWEFNNGENYLIVKNDENACKSPIINNTESVLDILNASYKNIPNWDISNFENILCNENSTEYIELPDSFIDDMISKKLCEININGHSILISRPFLGNMKKTTYVGYRVIAEDENRIVIKFKQSEDLGNIYTIAAFLNI